MQYIIKYDDITVPYTLHFRKRKSLSIRVGGVQKGDTEGGFERASSSENIGITGLEGNIIRGAQSGKYRLEASLLYFIKDSINTIPFPLVEVFAPEGLTLSVIEDFITKKRSWIYKHVLHFLKYSMSNTVIEYVSGAKILFLGREYTLQISTASKNTIAMEGDILYISSITTTHDSIKAQLYIWYKKQAKNIFLDLYEVCWKVFQEKMALYDKEIDILQKPDIVIRSMKRRWGSIRRNGNITLNLLLIKAPTECIKYVIFHELCHLVEFNHSKRYYELLYYIEPEYKAKKRRLESLL